MRLVGEARKGSGKVNRVQMMQGGEGQVKTSGKRP